MTYTLQNHRHTLVDSGSACDTAFIAAGGTRESRAAMQRCQALARPSAGTGHVIDDTAAARAIFEVTHP